MLRFILLTGLYLLGTWYATAFIGGPAQVTLFWPSAGIAFGAVLRYGWRHAFFIPVAVLIAHLTFVHVPVAFMPFSVLANFLGALAGAYVVDSTRTQLRVRVSSGFGMLRGGLVMALVTGTVGTIGLVLSHMVGEDAFWPALSKWAFGDLLGIICVTPSFLLLMAPGGSTNPDLPVAGDYSSARTKAGWVLAMAFALGFVYWGGSQNGVYALGMVALPLALLVWSALRFEPIWTALGTALTVLFLTTLTGLGLAGFKAPTGSLDSALLLGFMSLFGTIPLVLVASLNEQRMATRKVLRRATTDAATNLPNRAAFEEAVQRALAGQGPGDALAYLDLDHFTLINDTASHAAGDALIHGIASLLKARLRAGDQVFRIGGDEFALLLAGDAETMELRLQHLQRAVENYRVGWKNHVLNITVSIGLVTFKPGEIDYARLLSLADAACFTAKELGGNRVVPASQEPGEMHERTQAMHWALRIREAIDRNLFELDCQSIAPLGDHPVEGRHFEVLLRMRDPRTGERLAPDHFIPAAERFQLGVALDRHVVNLALGWLEARPDAAAQVHTCAINLTAASLVDEGFATFLYHRVRNGKLPAFKVCFEVTETSAVRDLSRAQGLITRMRSLGCAFALDDFGTGFCSFNYLRSLDVDYFKIDGSFVRDLESSSLSMAVIRSITDIAHVLNKQTIAEHTENDAIFASLRALGVDMAQGFGIHRPEPIEAYFARPSTAASVAGQLAGLSRSTS
jgi:diguanylate cyclase (GGDEF)-like protein